MKAGTREFVNNTGCAPAGHDLSAGGLVSLGARRDPLLDIIRGILITGVVIIHFGSEIFERSSWPVESIYLGIILNVLCHFCVPAFIFLSGYVHAKRYRQCSDVLGFYRRRFRSIVVPYLFVTGCYTLYAVLSPSHPGFGSLQHYLFLFFVAGMDGPLYFVPVIVQFYLLFPLLARVFSSSDSSDKNWIKLFLLSIGFHVLSGLLTYKGLLPFLVIRSSFVFWGPYFCAGMLFGFGRISKGRVHCLKRLAIPFLLAAVGLLYWAITAILWPFVLREFAFAYMRPVLMMYNAICVWLIALIILEGPQTSNRFFGWLGKNSLIIFLWHVPVLRVLLNVTPVDTNTAITTYFPFIPLIILAALMITGLGSAGWETAKARAGSYLGNLF